MFFALVALLFALLVTTHAQSHCTTTFWGNKIMFDTNIIQVSLPDVQIQRKVIRKTVEIPNEINKRVICLTGKHVGTRITACDFGAAPEVQLQGLSRAKVVRKSDASRIGTLFSAVYCKMPPNQDDKKDVLAPLYYKITN